MSPVKICTIVGARPQFVKAAVVSRALQAYPNVQEIIIHTGQHYDANMSSQFFDELSIPKPKYNLAIGSGRHGAQTGQMLSAIESVLLDEQPDYVLVYGDTNSTLAGALAAVKMHIPVAHVEAGLRSFNRRMPEEINRVMTDSISHLLFTPSQAAYQQLLHEGVDASHVVHTGDVMFDATLFYNELNAGRESVVERLSLTETSYGLVTLHRAENTDCSTRMNHIIDAFLELAAVHTLVWPVHPRTLAVLQSHPKFEALQQKLTLLEPVGFLDMLALEQHACVMITDSGGVQKEAYFNRVPCITLRDETEWVELVEAGWNTLCSPNQPFSLLHAFSSDTALLSANMNLYGDGSAAQKIAEIMSQPRTNENYL